MTQLTASPSSLSATPRVSRSAWMAVALLCPVAMLNYLDRQMLASMKFSIMADLPSIRTEANWGYMLGQFKWVYAVMTLLGGYLADRFSRRYAICGSLFVWSVITWSTGHVSTYRELLWTRSLMGISEAFYIPAALSLITDFHTRATRSLAVGLHQTAIYLGVIAGGLCGYVADSPALGWRFTFNACGVFGALYALPLLVLLRDLPKPATALNETRPSPFRAARELLSIGSFYLLVLYFTLPALAGWVVRDWMPAILRTQFHIGQGKAGVAATLYWQLAAIIGALGGGVLADRWMKRDRRGRIYISAIGMGLIVPAIFGVGVSGSLATAVGCLALFGLGYGFVDTNNMPILSQIVRPRLRATGYGMMSFVSISAGGLADWGFGTLRDRHVSLPVIFSLFAATAAVAAVVVLWIRPRNQLFAEEETV